MHSAVLQNISKKGQVAGDSQQWQGRELSTAGGDIKYITSVCFRNLTHEQHSSQICRTGDMEKYGCRNQKKSRALNETVNSFIL